MITQEQFDQIPNCRESLDYVASQPSLAAAWENCERPDWLLMFARKAEIASKEQFVRIAIGEAEAALPIWTTRYPDDDRPQKTIQAAKDWVADQTSGTRAASASAASYAATQAAYAAYAAYAAVNAANAAAYAVYAAVYTDCAANAGSAACAAACAAAAAADDKAAFHRAQCDRIRAIIPNPFVNRE